MQYSDGSFSKKPQRIACRLRHLLLWVDGYKKKIMANPAARSGGRFDISAMAETVLALLFALVSASWLFLVSSAFWTPSLSAALQSRRLSAVPSYELGSMPACFMSRLQTSLYRSCGLPVGRAPSHSSPYSMSLGMRPAAMRPRTWPSHLRRLLLKRANRLGIPARWRTSALVTLSCHLMFKSRLRQRRWKLFNRFSCPAYVVQDSLP